LEEKFVFREEAKKHLTENILYYEERAPGKGEEFAEDVYQKVQQISNRPLSHSVIYKDVRKASLSKFPFNIYYALHDAVVNILAIWHKSRNQDGWKRED
jgi:plasmid stabilization system protein ParE